MRKYSPYIYIIVILCIFYSCKTKTVNKAVFKPENTLMYKNDTIQFNLSEELIEPFGDYLIRAEKSGIDLSNLNQLQGLYYTNAISHYTGGNDYGLTLLYEPGKDFIFISDDINLYLPTFIEAILYHEFFHLILQTVEHCDGPICPYIIQDGTKINVEVVICNWGDAQKDEYFEYIKAQQK